MYQFAANKVKEGDESYRPAMNKLGKQLEQRYGIGAGQQPWLARLFGGLGGQSQQGVLGGIGQNKKKLTEIDPDFWIPVSDDPKERKRLSNLARLNKVGKLKDPEKRLMFMQKINQLASSSEFGGEAKEGMEAVYDYSQKEIDLITQKLEKEKAISGIPYKVFVGEKSLGKSGERYLAPSAEEIERIPHDMLYIHPTDGSLRRRYVNP